MHEIATSWPASANRGAISAVCCPYAVLVNGAFEWMRILMAVPSSR